VLVALLAASTAFSCADGSPRGPGAIVATPQPLASGTDGTDGPRAAARVTVHANVRVDELLDVEVTFPATAEGSLDPNGAPHPAVVFVHGGFVDASRYRWLSTHLATRGYVVIAPTHFADLAILETDNAILALRAVQHAAAGTGTLANAISRDESHPHAVVMGHSLGGVVAARQWIAHPFEGLVLLAGYAGEGDPVTSRTGSSVLSLVGANDVVRATAMDYITGFHAFPTPRLFASITGMNHMAWADETTADELENDGPETRPVPIVRRDALRILDLWLDETLLGDPEAQRALMATSFPGTTSVMR
jgi:pimeloyl-ACP methyl ester carboxylesterase